MKILIIMNEKEYSHSIFMCDGRRLNEFCRHIFHYFSIFQLLSHIVTDKINSLILIWIYNGRLLWRFVRLYSNWLRLVGQPAEQHLLSIQTLNTKL